MPLPEPEPWMRWLRLKPPKKHCPESLSKPRHGLHHSARAALTRVRHRGLLCVAAPANLPGTHLAALRRSDKGFRWPSRVGTPVRRSEGGLPV